MIGICRLRLLRNELSVPKVFDCNFLAMDGLSISNGFCRTVIFRVVSIVWRRIAVSSSTTSHFEEELFKKIILVEELNIVLAL